MGKRLDKNHAHYVDNKRLSDEVTAYALKYREAQANGGPEPRINNYVGECIIKIANRLASRPNFVRYSYKDEMIADGIENVVRYLHNFNPQKALDAGKRPNAFSYITTQIWMAYLRRIDKEKKQQYIKEKNIETAGILSEFASVQGGDDRKFKNDFLSIMQGGLNNLDYDQKRKEKKKLQQDKKNEADNIDPD